jgi:hypothetical protein
MPINCCHNTPEVYAQTTKAMVSKLIYDVNSKGEEQMFFLLNSPHFFGKLGNLTDSQS